MDFIFSFWCLRWNSSFLMFAFDSEFNNPIFILVNNRKDFDIMRNSDKITLTVGQLKRLIKESLMDKDLESLKNAILKLQKIGGSEKFDDMIFEDDKMESGLIRILSRYDKYMENVMWAAIECSNGVDDTARRIKDMAEENEYRKGTESRMVVEFLEELIRYLKL